MSEAKRVKGWAVWDLTYATDDRETAKDAWVGDINFLHPKNWVSKEDRLILPTKEEARTVLKNIQAVFADERHGIVRIVAKPKAPKPDKLEQAIAKVEQRMRAHAAAEENWVAQKRWSFADVASTCRRELESVVSALEALR